MHESPRLARLLGLATAILLAACAPTHPRDAATPNSTDRSAPDTAAVLGHRAVEDDAAAFVDSAETVLQDLAVRSARAAWVYATYITDDTQQIAADASEAYLNAAVPLALRAADYLHPELPSDVSRKLNILRSGFATPSPPNPKKTAELTRIGLDMEGMYGKGEYCPSEGECLNLEELTELMAVSRNADSLLMAWQGWRTISPPMRDDYVRFVELANEGARALGYSDLGAMWRSNYDMPADTFAAELDRLWEQVHPLYEALHCHVRAELAEQYGRDLVPESEPIPAHLLGNMWGQQWGNVFDLVAPADAHPGYDLTAALRKDDVEPREMVRIAERFFTSLDFEPLPQTFWTRSLFTKPADRDVVCHASAWNVDDVDDLRIKMCIDITAEEFQTVHHELGHNFYQRSYNRQPYLYRGGANDGFHEALGDAVALSVTPPYLKEIGLIDETPPPSKDIGLLLRSALDKVAFLPFGLLVDQWRWKVFSGEISPDEYNAEWWRLREYYQGVRAPVDRAATDFDPGAKYHVPANVPYTRYFLAHVLQFQFHRALCRASGYDGPLHRCSIYGSTEAGDRLRDMMELGASRPWPEALEMLTGTRELDATAMLDYFAPLEAWLDERNASRECGW